MCSYYNQNNSTTIYEKNISVHVWAKQKTVYVHVWLWMKQLRFVRILPIQIVGCMLNHYW